MSSPSFVRRAFATSKASGSSSMIKTFMVQFSLLKRLGHIPV